MKLLKLRYSLNSHTRLLACITLAISLIMSSVIFLSLANIQEQDVLTDIRFAKNLAQVYQLQVNSVINTLTDEPLSKFIEEIYVQTSSISYIFLVDSVNSIGPFFPEDMALKSAILSSKNTSSVFQHEKISFYDIKISYINILNQPILDIILPLFENGKNLFYLELGIVYNPSILFISSLIKEMSIALFVSIWLTSTFAIIFNAFIMILPIQILSQGIKSIASGNFSQRICLDASGVLGDLFIDFNQMAEKLECYEKTNINQLVLEKSKLETLVSIIADGAILLDKDLRIIFINQSASKIFKFLKSCITGTYIYNYLPDYINKQLLPILNEMIQVSPAYKANSDTRQFCLNLNHDISKTFQFIVTTILDPECQVITGIAIIIQDLTCQIGLNNAKAQFISNVSHELRTPLFNIRSFLETLSEYSNSLSEKQKIEFLEIANQETQRLTHLVNDVLDLSRLESGLLDSLELVEFHEIIPPIVQTSQLRASNKHVELSFQISYNVSSISGYTSLLIQVISNLVGNSLKFTQADGRIFLKVYPIRVYDLSRRNNVSKIRVEIIDEGTGIREFDQARIFDRFVRLENNIHTLEGTGLGLSIVQNIVDKHKSHISLYSELGSGSSFWFDLHVLEKKN
jgi:two-component system, OmpR family, sensor histidine kinase NblS